MEKTINNQEPIDVIEEEVRDIWKTEGGEETQLKKENIEKRTNPKFVQEMFNGLKNEIDYINNKPDNKRYFEEFLKAKKTYEKRWKNILELLKEGLKTLNITTTTGKSKFDENNKKRPVDYNDSDIDGKWVYLLLDEINFIKSDEADKNALQPKYLQWKIQGEKETRVEEWLIINEKQIGEKNGLEVREENKYAKAKKFIKQGENPFQNTIIAINNNIKHNDGPTSSTRMLYEILKEEWALQQLSKEKQKQMEKFVYFVDIAYRLKQRVIGMDYPYIHTTIFGNYKSLNIFDIYNYLENPEKTWFELIDDKKAQDITTRIGKKEWATKKYTEENLLDILSKKYEKIDIIKAWFNKIRDNKLTYKSKEKEGKTQIFLCDISWKLDFSEDVAGYLASGEMWFLKIHPNNEIFLRSYYDLPKKFGPFIIENANTLHGKLTEANIEEFLATLEWNEDIKNNIRIQFNKNRWAKSPEVEAKIGNTYKGIITAKKDFWVFVEITQWRNVSSWLLHKSQIKDWNMAKYKIWDSIDVVVKNITPDKKLNFGVFELTLDKIHTGDVFSGNISNISKDNTVFIKIKDTNISWILRTNIPKEEIKSTFTVDTAIKVKVVEKNGKWPIFQITQ